LKSIEAQRNLRSSPCRNPVYNEPFGDAVDLLLAPDHCLYRMLYSQGVLLDQLGVRTWQGVPV